MSDDDLHYLNGHEALALFRSKQLSPVELMLALIDRAEEVEPKINAFCDNYFDEALEQADLLFGWHTRPWCPEVF